MIDKCDTTLNALAMRVYYPSNHNYNTCKLPAIILFHAGSYAECSSYTNPGARGLSRKLCKRGFVVFDVNYRVGVIVDTRIVTGSLSPEYNHGLSYVSAQQMLAIYRALQDARGAIRSVLQMQLDGINSSLYKIDINNVFLAGMSAVSLLAMSAEYLGPGAAGQAKIDSLFPGVKAHLGPIDTTGVYYADAPASLNQDYFKRIKGILNCWGSLFIPNAYLTTPYTFFSTQGYTLPPIISFHGMKDTTFDYKAQGVYFSRSTADPNTGLFTNTESRCLENGAYTTPADDGLHPTRYEISIGSQTIYNMLHDNGILSELYLDCDAYHGLDVDEPLCGTCTFDPTNLFVKPGMGSSCIKCTYQSNFGTDANNTDKTYDYIAGRAATIFQTIIGGSTYYSNITTTRFVECENNRVTCDGTTSTGCADTDTCPN